MARPELLPDAGVAATDAMPGQPLRALGAKNGNLLYISDGPSPDIYVDTFPRAKLWAIIQSGSGGPGECADQKGNVFVAGYDDRIYEYAHGGMAPIAQLSDNPYTPESCSVDPTSGWLAVTNVGQGFNPSNVALFVNGNMLRTDTESGMSSYAFCTYDNKGHLFVDGTDSSGAFRLDESPGGTGGITNVYVSQHITAPGAVQWDGKYLAIGDAGTGKIYRFTVSRGIARLKGTTILNGWTGKYAFWIQGSIVIAPEAGTSQIQVWNYPAGGNATKTITGPFKSPRSVTVSLAQ